MTEDEWKVLCELHGHFHLKYHYSETLDEMWKEITILGRLFKMNFYANGDIPYYIFSSDGWKAKLDWVLAWDSNSFEGDQKKFAKDMLIIKMGIG